MAGVAGRHRHGERTNDDSAVNPHRDFLVNAHLLVVRVVDLAGLELANSVQDRAPVPAAQREEQPKGRASQLPAPQVRSGFRSYSQSDVRQSRANREVTSEIVYSVAGRVPRKALLVEGRLVERVVGVEDGELVVDRSCVILPASAPMRGSTDIYACTQSRQGRRETTREKARKRKCKREERRKGRNAAKEAIPRVPRQWERAYRSRRRAVDSKTGSVQRSKCWRRTSRRK